MKTKPLIGFLILLPWLAALAGCAPASTPTSLPTQTLPPVTALPEGVSIIPAAGKSFYDQVYCRMAEMDLIFDLHYPETGEGPYPLVVYVHGGAWRAGDRRGGAGVAFRDALLEAGYAFGAVDYRLAPEYPFPAQIEDVKCAIRFFRANAALLDLDPARFAALGGSAGGHLVALLGLTADQDLWESAGPYQGVSSGVAAVVDMFGPTDLRPMTVPAYRDPYVGVFGDAVYDADAIWDYSPLAYVSADAAPFLIMHGDADRVVMLHHSEDLAAALEEVGVPVALLVVDGGGHSTELFAKGASPDLDSLTQSLLAYLGEYLK